MDRYGKRWSDINKPQRMMLELLHETTFKRLEREIKSDRRVYSNEKALNEAKKAEKFVRRRLTKEAKSIYKDFSLDLSRNQGGEALNDEQYNEWISAFAEELNRIAWAIPNLSEDRQDEWVNIARKKTLNAIQEKYKLKIP
jgi:histone H3/H4